ncbi:unnamed protein product [Orchesella dallaii]|uniref:Uncharacterized protein n=1 Tax=Orchesella dallaii TaxID=48710 RepID=A0ABP1RJ55_9HEXA
MKVLFVVVAIFAVTYAATVVDKDKVIESGKPAENKTLPADKPAEKPADKPAREARYVLLGNSGRLYDRVLNNVVSDVVVDRSSYVVSSPYISRSSYLSYY